MLLNTSNSFINICFQLKNSESILEYERMAEIGFDKRDFRMVSWTVIGICPSADEHQRITVG